MSRVNPAESDSYEETVASIFLTGRSVSRVYPLASP